MRLSSTGTLDIKNSALPRLRLIENTSVGNPTIQLLDYSNADSPTEGLEIKYESGTGNSFIKNIYSGGALIFQTAGANEAMRILQNQYLTIGYTSSNGSYRLQVNSQIFATSASIATSDEKYKENIKTLEGGLGIIKSLRPVEFDWKKQKDVKDKEGNILREAHNFVNGKSIGFIAQEVQKAVKGNKWADNIVKSNIREAIKNEKGDIIVEEEKFLGIAETHLIPILVSAIQELTERLEKLEGKK
jgi:hypothetical protein